VSRPFILATTLIACIGAVAAIPGWLTAKPGAVVFTSAGEEDSPTTPVCATMASYHAYVNENGAKGCTERPAGAKVVIDKVRAASGAFHGYTAVTELLPPIPPGVRVMLARAASETLTIAPNQRTDLGIGTNLGSRASAVTVRLDPASDTRDLLVRVTSGKYSGKSGWLFARQAFIGDLPINVLRP
jgi:hypothetical protein